MTNKIILETIKESYGKVVYTHKVHEKESEIKAKTSKHIKLLNMILIALLSGSILRMIFLNNIKQIYISAFLSAASLALAIYQLSFRPEELGEKHKQTAKELWYIREKYLNLITDIYNECIEDKEIIRQRDELTDKLNYIYKFAPSTSRKAYKMAQKALKVEEESTFSKNEIDSFLPEYMRNFKSGKNNQ